MKCSGFAAILGICLSVPLTSTYASTFTFNCGSPPALSTLNGAFAGTTAWTNNGSGSPGTGIPANGDIVALTGICAGDVVVTESGFNIIGATGNTSIPPDVNHNPNGSSNPPALSNYNDGINGQINLGGVQRVKINGLFLFGAALSAGTHDPAGDTEAADVYAHDASAVVLQNDYIGSDPSSGATNVSNLMGVFAARSTSVTLLNTLVTDAGIANTFNYTSGVQAALASVLRLGLPDGSQPSSVTANANGNGISVLQTSAAELNASAVTGNGLSQILAMTGASVHLSGATVTTTSNSPAVRLLEASGAQVDNASTIDATASTVAGAVLITGGGNVLINNSTFKALGSSQPVIEVSTAASLVLAGGNTIQATGTSTTQDIAIQIDHSSALTQQLATAVGFPTAAPDTVTGDALIQVQSSMDLGQGNIGASPSITWTTLTTATGVFAQQNSSFRVSGGVTINGKVIIDQGSNGFANTNVGGTNNITTTVCPFTNIPGSHFAAPTKVTPNVPSSTTFSGTVTPECMAF